jgi:signal transduction histidine kinase/ActR/RegA family two-component response regulator
MAHDSPTPVSIREGFRILICAPDGEEASSAATQLSCSGHDAQICADLDEIAARFDHRAGAVLITDEALSGRDVLLTAALDGQPSWSDTPFILLTSRGPDGRPPPGASDRPLFRRITHCTVLERPLGTRSLLSAVSTALRHRRLQFDLRDRTEELRQTREALEIKVAERTAALEIEMTNRAQAESALRQSQKMEAVGQLTGGIAHDFNNMLSGIIGSLEILKRRIAAGRLDDVQRFMDAAWASAARAASLTQRLLAFSRRQSLDARIVDLNALVRSLEVLLRRTINEQSTLAIDLSPDMPAGIVDANQLESAILNLAINARDAMPAGGLITIKTRRADVTDGVAAAALGLAPGRYVSISVDDTGVGMTPELLERAFEPFFTTKPLGQGTGLGLSMVYGFAKQSGGQVRIQSKPGMGTAVTLYLPATDREPDGAARSPGPQVHGGDGESVLFVEDDASVRMLIRDVLQELGYSPIEAAEPESALPILASEQRIDLMISDVGLPGMNGRQLAEVARKHRPQLPILFITGYAENAAIRAGFLGSNMAMIMKPFTIDTLAAKIADMTRSRVH